MKNMYAVEHSGTILRHLTEIGAIHSREAIEKYGIFQLQKCISYLKKQGYKIRDEEREKTNQYGDRVVYYVYTLVSEPKEKE